MTLRALIALCCCLFSARGVCADPIGVTFIVFPAPSDPVNMTRSVGSFSFDSSLIVPGGQLHNSKDGLGATSVDFRWASTTYTAQNADISALWFGATGQLIGWALGGKVSAFDAINGMLTRTDDFEMIALAGFERDFNYTLAGHPNVVFKGTLFTDSVAPPIPEPSTMLLVASGVAGIVRRRRSFKPRALNL